MKKILITLTLPILFFLHACTSDEGKLKEAALQLGKQKFAETLKLEAEEELTKSEWLRQAYVDFMKDISEVEVQQIKIEGSSALVTLQVKTYSLYLRRTVLKVANSVDKTKSRSFSFSEALRLISQTNDKKFDPQPLGVYKFAKSSDRWVLQ